MGSPRPKKTAPPTTPTGATRTRAALPRTAVADRREARDARDLVLPVRPDVRAPVRPIGVRAPARIGEKSI